MKKILPITALTFMLAGTAHAADTIAAKREGINLVDPVVIVLKRLQSADLTPINIEKESSNYETTALAPNGCKLEINFDLLGAPQSTFLDYHAMKSMDQILDNLLKKNNYRKVTEVEINKNCNYVVSLSNIADKKIKVIVDAMTGQVKSEE